jgi:hypothetical protein
MNKKVTEWFDYIYESLVTLMAKYGDPNDFGARNARAEVAKSDIKRIQDNAPSSDYAVKITVANPTVEQVMDSLIQLQNVVIADAMTTETYESLHAIGQQLYEQYGFSFDEDLIMAEFHDKTWEDRVYTHSAQLQRDMSVILYAVLYGKITQAVARSRMLDRYEVFSTKIQTIVNTESTRIRAEYIKTNVPAETKFTFVANPNACSRCEPHDGQVYTVAHIEEYLPIHSNCKCTLELLN